MPRLPFVPTVVALLLLVSIHPALAERPAKHEAYAKELWGFLHRDGKAYTSWKTPTAVGPAAVLGPVTAGTNYANSRAIEDSNSYGAVVVTEHRDGEDLVSVTVRYRPEAGFDADNDDWYWVHYDADGAVLATSVDVPTADAAGSLVEVLDRKVIRVHSTSARPGFFTKLVDGRLWVLRSDDESVAKWADDGAPEKHVTRVGAGPGGVTIKSSDAATIDDYLVGKPGFTVRPGEDGRYWVFEAGSDALQAFDADGAPEKHVTRPGAGPAGQTLKSTEAATLDAYAAASGAAFETMTEDGRLWVFTAGSEAAIKAAVEGLPEKHVTRIGAGPGGATLKGPDAATLDAYERALGLAD